MLITTYTTYNDVRAMLGVNDEELEDGTLALESFSTGLQLDLEDIDQTLPATYAALPPTGRTATQERFYLTTRLFATYSVAMQLSTSLPLFSPKNVTDGKAAVGRYADSPYKDVIKKIQADYDRYRARLEKAFAALSSASYTLTPPTLMVVASPTSDPVTGT